MKITFKFFVAFLLIIQITACSPSVPECNSDEAKDLVKQIVREDLDANLPALLSVLSANGMVEPYVNSSNINLDLIRTKNVNEKTGKRSCLAEYYTYVKSGDQSRQIAIGRDIEYTVEMLDGKDEVYVELFFTSKIKEKNY